MKQISVIAWLFVTTIIAAQNNDNGAIDTAAGNSFKKGNCKYSTINK